MKKLQFLSAETEKKKVAVKQKKAAGDAWYAERGTDDDVVLSSKVTLCRNLANFPFPSRLTPIDDEHIQAIVFDAFNRCQNADDFHSLKISALDKTGFQIMCERGILDENCRSEGAVILRNDGILSCTVDSGDHIRMSAFSSGLELESLSNFLRETDEKLQGCIQYAASYDFGYLNENLLESGSGMKLSVRLHLPALTLMERLPSLIRDTEKDSLSLRGCFGAGGATLISCLGGKGSSLGFYYILENRDSCTGSELEQLTNIVTWVKRIVMMERSERDACAKGIPSQIKNYIHRAVSIARSSVFIKFREAVEIISAVKLGRDLQLLTGVDEKSLHALLYRIQNGHLEYVLKNGLFTFEDDINSSVQRSDNMRSRILQEAFEDIKLSL